LEIDSSHTTSPNSAALYSELGFFITSVSCGRPFSKNIFGKSERGERERRRRLIIDLKTWIKVLLGKEGEKKDGAG